MPTTPFRWLAKVEGKSKAKSNRKNSVSAELHRYVVTLVFAVAVGLLSP